MAEKCYKCFRPLVTCYCKSIKQIKTEIKFVILIHPKEAYKQKTGTGRLAHLSLADSELIVGVDFTDNPKVNALLNDSSYLPVLLYPGKKAITASSNELKQELSDKKLLVFIIDATWSSAKKMLYLSNNLHDLTNISFNNRYVSKFIIKRQPGLFCLSTVESVYYLIREFKSEGIIEEYVNPNGLMGVFQKMIDFQIKCTLDRNKISYRKRKSINSKRKSHIISRKQRDKVPSLERRYYEI